MNVTFYEDRCLANMLPLHVRKALESESLLNSNDKNLDFCGIIMDKRNIDIFLPRNSIMTIPAPSKKLAATLIIAIHKYAKDRNRTSLREGTDDHIVGGSLLELAFTILTDYVEHGLYTRRNPVSRSNTGKTDWKKTIRRKQGFPLSNSFVYLDTFGRKNNTIYDDEVTRIHAETIRELNYLFGWIFFGVDSSIPLELANITQPTGDTKEKISMLEIELGKLYADREMKLMKDLILFLSKEESTTRGSNLIIGIKKFESMWEGMIDSCMQWKFDINQKLAKPSYLINEKYLMSAQRGGRTDTVISSPDKSTFSIIDAKYYGGNCISTMPGWPDLIKQFFYAAALKDIYPKATIYNYFILPGSEVKVTSAHLQDPKTKALKDSKYPPIKCIYLEPMKLINCYVSGRKLIKLSTSMLYPNNADY